MASVTSARAQSTSDQAITPKFVPVTQRPTMPIQPPNVFPTGGITPAAFVEPKPVAPQPRKPGAADESPEVYVRLELPGPQRLFTRESESQFFERLAQDIRKQPGARALFPPEQVINRQSVTQMPFPRRDPITKKPFELRDCSVEPFYVCHGRLFFEQPNFERTGWNFGVFQPAISLGVFYYDLALLPYHACSDLRGSGECSVGKCLPGDPAPLLVPRERFSVTGAVGQTGVILGGLYLFPLNLALQ